MVQTFYREPVESILIFSQCGTGRKFRELRWYRNLPFLIGARSQKKGCLNLLAAFQMENLVRQYLILKVCTIRLKPAKLGFSSIANTFVLEQPLAPAPNIL